MRSLQDAPGAAASARFTHEASDVIFLPVGPRQGAAEAVMRCLELLPPRDLYPEYLDELDITGETAVKDEIEQLEAELSELRKRLDAGRSVKRIMFFTDYDLEVEAIRFLNDELGARARHVTGSDEDAWLVSDTGQEWAIVEVKGTGRRNVAKGHVADVISHRHKAGRPDDFPAFLVVNTFHRGQTLEERDRPVERDVVRFAAAQRVLIARTLDLLRLKRLATQNPQATETLLNAIGEDGGWFEVDDEGNVTVHRN